MAEHNWRELLDDPEIEGIVSRVYNGPGRRYYGKSSDSLALDDLESWLWDKAVDIAMHHDVSHVTTYDAKRLWYATLYKQLTMMIKKNNHYAAYYGSPGTSKRAAGIQYHHSIEAENEASGGNFFAHRITGGDPLAIALKIEALEERLARSAEQSRPTMVLDGLCSEPMCRAPIQASGLCGRHYRTMRTQWLTAPCAIDGCTEPTQAKGLCENHYAAQRRDSLGACLSDGCANKAQYRGTGLCQRHHQGRGLTPAARHTHCTIPGCNQPHRAKGMCMAHYQQSRKDIRNERRRKGRWQ